MSSLIFDILMILWPEHQAPESDSFRPNFTSNLVRGLAFGTPIFYIAPYGKYGKINYGLVNLSSNCDVKSGLSAEELLNV